MLLKEVFVHLRLIPTPLEKRLQDGRREPLENEHCQSLWKIALQKALNTVPAFDLVKKTNNDLPCRNFLKMLFLQRRNGRILF
jgi:hypothetical protein